MPRADQITIRFRRPDPGTEWQVLITQEMCATYQIVMPDAIVADAFDPVDPVPTERAIKRHALGLLARGQATLVGAEVDSAYIASRQPHGSDAARDALTRALGSIDRAAADHTGDLTGVHASAWAAIRWHAAHHIAILRDAVRRHVPGAEYILADLRPWFDTRDLPYIAGTGDEFGPIGVTGHAAWPALRDLVAEHLACALETATPTMCGWRPLDPDHVEADQALITAAGIDVEDTDLFQIPLAGLVDELNGTIPARSAWRDDLLQFARLIAEMDAAGAFDPGTYTTLQAEMDLEADELTELINRAQTLWDHRKGNTPGRPGPCS